MKILNRLLVIGFATHFVVLFIHLSGDLEITPKKVSALTTWTDNYINPFFEQNWGMFAPNPPTSNLHVFVQYAVPDKNSTSYSPWYDIYSPVISQNYGAYFSLNQRLLKYFHGCTMEVYKAGFEGATALSGQEKTMRARESYGYRSLRRYARIAYGIPKSQIDNKKIKFRFKFINVYFPEYKDRKKEYLANEAKEYSILETAVDKL